MIGTKFVALPTSCACGGSTAWYLLDDGVEIGAGCTCHQHPAQLDLDTRTPVPEKIWLVVAQRGVVLVHGDEHEARRELEEMDDKHRPAYLLTVPVTQLEVVGTIDVSSEARFA